MNESILDFLVTGVLPCDCGRDQTWREFLMSSLEPVRKEFLDRVHVEYGKSKSKERLGDKNG